MNILVWTLYTARMPDEAKEKPFVTFYKPGETIEHSFQITQARMLNSGACWKFFPSVKDELSASSRPCIFVVTDKVRYKAWPDVVMNQRLVQAFLHDNKVQMI